jgi:hypothetical protein
MKPLYANVKNITKRRVARFGKDKFGTANGNRTRILALKGLRANRCTIAALLGELEPINYTENFDFALRSTECHPRDARHYFRSSHSSCQAV